MEPFVGEIRIFAGSYAPVGWLLCNGSLQNITDYEVLYSLLGTTYGGDGVRQFGLPDLRGRIPVNQGQGTGLTARTVGQSFGAEAVTITTDQIPSHTHLLQGSLNAATTNDPTSNVYATTATNFYDVTTDDPTKVKAFSPKAVLSTTGDQPHTNIMPYLVVNYIICVQGIYPQRP